jgi:hypothetical protein
MNLGSENIMSNRKSYNNKFKNNAERIEYLDKKHEEIKENQENNLVLDFDEAIEEEKNKAGKIVIKMLGKVFELPKKMPFNFSTFFLRNCYKKIDGEFVVVFPENKILEYLELMFGSEFINTLNNEKYSDISIDFIFKNIVPDVMKVWGYKVDTKRNKEIQKKMVNRA